MFDYTNIRRESLELEKNVLFKLASPDAKHFFGYLYYQYINIGLCDLLLCTNIKNVKQWFYRAAWVELLEFKIASGQVNIKYELDRPIFSSTCARGFIHILLSDSDGLIHNYSKNVNISGDRDFDFGTYGYYVSYALKHILLSNSTLAEFFVNEALSKKAQKSSGYYKGIAITLKGIIERNKKLVQTGIEMQVVFHKKMEKGSPFYAVALLPTALAKLANRFDLLEDISNPLINKDLLLKQEDIPYFELTDVLKQLGANTNS